MIKFQTLALVSLFAIAACNDKHDDHAEGGGGHAHAAKHGGDLLELGDHEGFLEVKMNHDAGTITIWAYAGEEMADAKLDEAPVLNLTAGGAAKQVKGEEADGAWFFLDDALKGEPEGARFRIVMGGKTYSPKWEHQHEGDGHDEHD